jgi:hypothetical protein
MSKNKIFEKYLREELTTPVIFGEPYENTGIIAVNKEVEGTGGGGTAVYYTYEAGVGAYVLANGEDITYSKASGTGTFIIPEGVTLLAATVHGNGSDLNSNSFSIVFDGHFLNDALATLFPPTVTKYDRLLGGTPSEALPYTYDIDNTPQIQITNVNPLKIRVINLNGIVNWGLKIQM